MSFITVALVFNIYCVSRAENNVDLSSERSLFIYIYIYIHTHIYIYTHMYNKAQCLWMWKTSQRLGVLQRNDKQGKTPETLSSFSKWKVTGLSHIIEDMVKKSVPYYATE